MNLVTFYCPFFVLRICIIEYGFSLSMKVIFCKILVPVFAVCISNFFFFLSFSFNAFLCNNGRSVKSAQRLIRNTRNIELYFTILYCTVFYCNALITTLLYCTALHWTVLHSTLLFCTVFYCNALINPLLYCIKLHWTILHSTLLYCTLELLREN